MTYKNIASILNTQIIQNMLGQSVTVAEDLNNIVEFGTAVSALTADQMKDFAKKLIVGVHNYVLVREYEGKEFGFLRTATEYAGAIQRLMASGLYTAQDSHILNLVNGTSYLDGKYYGAPIDSKVYEQTKAFKVVHSIAEDDFKAKFMDANEVSAFISLIATTERNTVRIELAQLEKRILTALAYQTYKDARKVNLVTKFNADLLGKASGADGYKTYADINADRHLKAYFDDFCKQCIERVRDGMTDPNEKYNDGSVITFTPSSMVRTVLISEFATAVKYLSDPVDINAPSMGEYKAITAWQNNGSEMLPGLSTTASITVVNGESSDTVTNIVGMVYDSECGGIDVRLDKVTVEPVGSEGFINYHHHLANNFYTDSRLGAVVFTLD